MPPSPDLCFAEGTAEAYVEQVMSRALFQTPRSSLSPDPVQKFRLPLRWTETATDGSGLTMGDPTTLTWGVVQDGTALPSGAGEPQAPSSLRAWMVTVFGSVENGLLVFQAVFDRWSELSGVNYVYEPNDDGSSIPDNNGTLGIKADVRLGGHPIDGGWGVFGFSYGQDWGDVVIDTSDSVLMRTANNYIWLRNVLGHESGHGLGFRHVCPMDESKLMEAFVVDDFDGPQHDEILGVGRAYGDPYEHNDTAATATPTGALDNGLFFIGDGGLDDDTDVDLYRFSLAAPAELEATLTPVGQTYQEGPYQGGCGATSPYNSLDNHDLRLEILDGSEVPIATADFNPAAGAEALTDLLLHNAGIYYVRVSTTSSSDEPQLYTLTIGTENAAFIFADGFESGDTTWWLVTVAK